MAAIGAAPQKREVASSKNYHRELGANRAIYGSSVDAASQTRDVGMEAPKLREAAVIAAVGHESLREVGQGMRIRF